VELCRTFSGDATSGTEMLGHCRDEKSMGWITGYCTGVIVGLLTAAPHMEAEVRFCPPNGITPTQARRVVVRYLEQNPQITHRELRYLGDRGAAKSMGRLRPDVYSLRPAGRRTPAACTLPRPANRQGRRLLAKCMTICRSQADISTPPAGVRK